MTLRVQAPKLLNKRKLSVYLRICVTRTPATSATSCILIDQIHFALVWPIAMLTAGGILWNYTHLFQALSQI